MDFKNVVDDYDIIAIDEGQMFSDIKDFVLIVLSKRKKIIISALDGDYLQNPFKNIMKILPYADCVVKLTSVCSI